MPKPIKKSKEKKFQEIEKIKDLHKKFNTVLLFKSKFLNNSVLTDLRNKLKDSIIFYGKKSLFKKFCEDEKLKISENFLENIKQNSFFIFTNSKDECIDIINNYGDITGYPLLGDKVEYKIPVGQALFNDKPVKIKNIGNFQNYPISLNENKEVIVEKEILITDISKENLNFLKLIKYEKEVAKIELCDFLNKI